MKDWVPDNPSQEEWERRFKSFANTDAAAEPISEGAAAEPVPTDS